MGQNLSFWLLVRKFNYLMKYSRISFNFAAKIQTYLKVIKVTFLSTFFWGLLEQCGILSIASIRLLKINLVLTHL